MEFDGSISYVSPSVEMVRGFTVQEAIRQPLTEILAPDSQRVMLHYFSQLTTNVQAGIHPKDFRGDLEYRCKDGSTVWTEVIAFPLLDSDGGFVQLVGVTRDISERKRTEAVLREQKARLDFALTASGLGFWDWDIPSGHVLFGNRVLAMLSYAPEEIVSDAIGWEQLVHHDDKAAVLELRQNHLDGDSVMFEAEYRLRHKDGHWVWILDRGKVIAREADGKPLRMTGTYEDISHRKHLESESTNLLSQIQRLMHEAIRPNYLGNDASPVKEKKTDQLTRRQREITCLVASGLTSVDIAKRLNIATETVEAHRRDVMRKLDLHSVAALTRLAIQERLLSDE
jgi:PAS domain S-box-containing protein